MRHGTGGNWSGMRMRSAVSIRRNQVSSLMISFQTFRHMSIRCLQVSTTAENNELLDHFVRPLAFGFSFIFDICDNCPSECIMHCCNEKKQSVTGQLSVSIHLHLSSLCIWHLSFDWQTAQVSACTEKNLTTATNGFNYISSKFRDTCFPMDKC